MLPKTNQRFCLALAMAITLSPSLWADQRVPVLLELFTSEGCSSCPPADRVLEQLDKLQPVSGAEIVVLSEHVDYWNHLGWSDPYSSAAMSRRQHEYSRRLGLSGVYTPQLVVNGTSELIGSSLEDARAAVKKALRSPAVPITLSVGPRQDARVPVHIAFPAGIQEKTAVLVALADDWTESSVARGENSGRQLRHVAVVRQLLDVGTIAGGASVVKDVTLTVPPGAGLNGLRVVAIASDLKTGRVVGVARQNVAR